MTKAYICFLLLASLGCKSRHQNSTLNSTSRELVRKYNADFDSRSLFYMPLNNMPFEWLDKNFDSLWKQARILFKDDRGYYLQKYAFELQLAVIAKAQPANQAAQNSVPTILQKKQAVTPIEQPTIESMQSILIKEPLKYELDVFGSPNLARMMMVLLQINYPQYPYELTIREQLIAARSGYSDEDFVKRRFNSFEFDNKENFLAAFIDSASKGYIIHPSVTFSRFFFGGLDEQKTQRTCGLEKKLGLPLQMFLGLKQGVVGIRNSHSSFVDFSEPRIRAGYSDISPLDLLSEVKPKSRMDPAFDADLKKFRGIEQPENPNQQSPEKQQDQLDPSRQFGALSSEQAQKILSPEELKLIRGPIEQKIAAQEKTNQEKEGEQQEDLSEQPKYYDHKDMVSSPMLWQINTALNIGEWYCNQSDYPPVIIAKNKNANPFNVLRTLVETGIKGDLRVVSYKIRKAGVIRL